MVNVSFCKLIEFIRSCLLCPYIYKVYSLSSYGKKAVLLPAVFSVTVCYFFTVHCHHYCVFISCCRHLSRPLSLPSLLSLSVIVSQSVNTYFCVCLCHWVCTCFCRMWSTRHCSCFSLPVCPRHCNIFFFHLSSPLSAWSLSLVAIFLSRSITYHGPCLPTCHITARCCHLSHMVILSLVCRLFLPIPPFCHRLYMPLSLSSVTNRCYVGSLCHSPNFHASDPVTTSSVPVTVTQGEE